MHESLSIYVHSLCSVIGASNDVDNVITLLQLAVDSLLDFDSSHTSCTVDESKYASLAADLTSYVENQRDVDPIQRLEAFYSSRFQEFGEVLLTGVCVLLLRCVLFVFLDHY